MALMNILPLSSDNWERTHELKKLDHGKWELVLPPVNGKPAIPHMCKVKVRVCTERLDHISPV